MSTHTPDTHTDSNEAIGPETTDNETLLQVKSLKKYFPVYRGTLIRRHAGHVHAVDDISFHVKPGETLGLVGESGCGKSTTGYSIMHLEEPTAGEVVFEGQDIVQLPANERRSARRQMSFTDQKKNGVHEFKNCLIWSGLLPTMPSAIHTNSPVASVNE